MQTKITTIDIHIKKKKQPKHNTKSSRRITREENKRGREEKKTQKNKSKTIKKSYISIITLNINGLNAPTKRHRLAEWIQTQDHYTCCLQETHFRSRDTYRQKVRD